MKHNPQDLEKIAGLTPGHYNQQAEEFWEGRANPHGHNEEGCLAPVRTRTVCA